MIYCHAFICSKALPIVYLRINKQTNPTTFQQFSSFWIYRKVLFGKFRKKNNADDGKKKHCRRKIQITNFQNLMGFMSGSGYKKNLGPPTSWFQNMNLVVFPIIFLWNCVFWRKTKAEQIPHCALPYFLPKLIINNKRREVKKRKTSKKMRKILHDACNPT